MKEEKTESDEIEVEPVHDPEGYLQERRLKDIYDARETVRERRIKAKELQLESQRRNGDSLDAVRLYRTAVENYLTELKTLFLEDDRGKQYWYEADVGEIIIPPPDNPNYRTKPEPKSIDLTGLNCLFSLPEPIVAEWEACVSVGLSGGRTETETMERIATVSFHHLDLIVQSANQFLAEKGFELDPHEDTEPASI